VRTAFSYKGGQGFWSGAAQQQPEPDPPHTETTYVLGWPKSQQSISDHRPVLLADEPGWPDGGVIDVEFILGEADTPKRSECLGRP
jgi:hypothetical protein